MYSKLMSLPSLYYKMKYSKNIIKTLESYRGIDWGLIPFKVPYENNYNEYSIFKFNNNNELLLLVHGTKSYQPIYGNNYILPLDNKIKIINEKNTCLLNEYNALYLNGDNIIVNDSYQRAISLFYKC